MVDQNPHLNPLVSEEQDNVNPDLIIPTEGQLKLSEIFESPFLFPELRNTIEFLVENSSIRDIEPILPSDVASILGISTETVSESQDDVVDLDHRLGLAENVLAQAVVSNNSQTRGTPVGGSNRAPGELPTVEELQWAIENDPDLRRDMHQVLSSISRPDAAIDHPSLLSAYRQVLVLRDRRSLLRRMRADEITAAMAVVESGVSAMSSWDRACVRSYIADHTDNVPDAEYNESSSSKERNSLHSHLSNSKLPWNSDIPFTSTLERARLASESFNGPVTRDLTPLVSGSDMYILTRIPMSEAFADAVAGERSGLIFTEATVNSEMLVDEDDYFDEDGNIRTFCRYNSSESPAPNASVPIVNSNPLPVGSNHPVIGSSELEAQEKRSDILVSEVSAPFINHSNQSRETALLAGVHDSPSIRSGLSPWTYSYVSPSREPLSATETASLSADSLNAISLFSPCAPASSVRHAFETLDEPGYDDGVPSSSVEDFLAGPRQRRLSDISISSEPSEDPQRPVHTRRIPGLRVAAIITNDHSVSAEEGWLRPQDIILGVTPPNSDNSSVSSLTSGMNALAVEYLYGSPGALPSGWSSLALRSAATAGASLLVARARNTILLEAGVRARAPADTLCVPWPIPHASGTSLDPAHSLPPAAGDAAAIWISRDSLPDFATQNSLFPPSQADSHAKDHVEGKAIDQNSLEVEEQTNKLGNERLASSLGELSGSNASLPFSGFHMGVEAGSFPAYSSNAMFPPSNSTSSTPNGSRLAMYAPTGIDRPDAGLTDVSYKRGKGVSTAAAAAATASQSTSSSAASASTNITNSALAPLVAAGSAGFLGGGWGISAAPIGPMPLLAAPLVTSTPVPPPVLGAPAPLNLAGDILDPFIAPVSHRGSSTGVKSLDSKEKAENPLFFGAADASLPSPHSNMNSGVSLSLDARGTKSSVAGTAVTPSSGLTATESLSASAVVVPKPIPNASWSYDARVGAPLPLLPPLEPVGPYLYSVLVAGLRAEWRRSRILSAQQASGVASHALLVQSPAAAAAAAAAAAPRLPPTPFDPLSKPKPVCTSSENTTSHSNTRGSTANHGTSLNSPYGLIPEQFGPDPWAFCTFDGPIKVNLKSLQASSMRRLLSAIGAPSDGDKLTLMERIRALLVSPVLAQEESSSPTRSASVVNDNASASATASGAASASAGKTNAETGTSSPTPGAAAGIVDPSTEAEAEGPTISALELAATICASLTPQHRVVVVNNSRIWAYNVSPPVISEKTEAQLVAEHYAFPDLLIAHPLYEEIATQTADEVPASTARIDGPGKPRGRGKKSESSVLKSAAASTTSSAPSDLTLTRKRGGSLATELLHASSSPSPAASSSPAAGSSKSRRIHQAVTPAQPSHTAHTPQPVPDLTASPTASQMVQSLKTDLQEGDLELLEDIELLPAPALLSSVSTDVEDGEAEAEDMEVDVSEASDGITPVDDSKEEVGEAQESGESAESTEDAVDSLKREPMTSPTTDADGGVRVVLAVPSGSEESSLVPESISTQEGSKMALFPSFTDSPRPDSSSSSLPTSSSSSSLNLEAPSNWNIVTPMRSISSPAPSISTSVGVGPFMGVTFPSHTSVMDTLSNSLRQVPLALAAGTEDSLRTFVALAPPLPGHIEAASPLDALPQDRLRSGQRLRVPEPADVLTPLLGAVLAATADRTTYLVAAAAAPHPLGAAGRAVRDLCAALGPAVCVRAHSLHGLAFAASVDALLLREPAWTRSAELSLCRTIFSSLRRAGSVPAAATAAALASANAAAGLAQAGAAAAAAPAGTTPGAGSSADKERLKELNLLRSGSLFPHGTAPPELLAPTDIGNAVVIDPTAVPILQTRSAMRQLQALMRRFLPRCLAGAQALNTRAHAACAVMRLALAHPSLPSSDDEEDVYFRQLVPSLLYARDYAIGVIRPPDLRKIPVSGLVSVSTGPQTKLRASQWCVPGSPYSVLATLLPVLPVYGAFDADGSSVEVQRLMPDLEVDSFFQSQQIAGTEKTSDENDSSKIQKEAVQTRVCVSLTERISYRSIARLAALEGPVASALTQYLDSYSPFLLAGGVNAGTEENPAVLGAVAIASSVLVTAASIPSRHWRERARKRSANVSSSSNTSISSSNAADAYIEKPAVFTDLVSETTTAEGAEGTGLATEAEATGLSHSEMSVRVSQTVRSLNAVKEAVDGFSLSDIVRTSLDATAASVGLQDSGSDALSASPVPSSPLLSAASPVSSALSLPATGLVLPAALSVNLAHSVAGDDEAFSSPSTVPSTVSQRPRASSLSEIIYPASTAQSASQSLSQSPFLASGMEHTDLTLEERADSVVEPTAADIPLDAPEVAESARPESVELVAREEAIAALMNAAKATAESFLKFSTMLGAARAQVLSLNFAFAASNRPVIPREAVPNGVTEAFLLRLARRLGSNTPFSGVLPLVPLPSGPPLGTGMGMGMDSSSDPAAGPAVHLGRRWGSYSTESLRQLASQLRALSVPQLRLLRTLPPTGTRPQLDRTSLRLWKLLQRAHDSGLSGEFRSEQSPENALQRRFRVLRQLEQLLDLHAAVKAVTAQRRLRALADAARARGLQPLARTLEGLPPSRFLDFKGYLSVSRSVRPSSAGPVPPEWATKGPFQRIVPLNKWLVRSTATEKKTENSLKVVDVFQTPSGDILSFVCTLLALHSPGAAAALARRYVVVAEPGLTPFARDRLLLLPLLQYAIDGCLSTPLGQVLHAPSAVLEFVLFAARRACSQSLVLN